MERDELIRHYFEMGLSFPEIIMVLAHKHKIVLSERTAKRKCADLGLFRRKNKSDILEVALFVEKMLESCGQLHGYRWMYWQAILAGYRVSQNEIRQLLLLQDHDGVCLRKKNRLRRRIYGNKGPNFVWHVDGNDKLKRFGIAIHGCIDGYSRHLIWLKAGRTNNDPLVIANYYLAAVEDVGGCPAKIRADKGTENTVIEQLQIFFRRNHNDINAGEKSFVYGSSNHNQRIEWFWGLLRKECLQFWIDLFQMIKEDLDSFSGDWLDKELVRFCFCGLIQRDLDKVKSVWHAHALQHKKNYSGVRGKPYLLYHTPELYQARDHVFDVDVDDFISCREEVDINGLYICDPDVAELIDLIMTENQYRRPNNIEEAVELYLNLRNSILQQLYSE